MSGLDFFTSQEVFRKNHPVVIANNRHLASVIGARLAYNALGFAAGTVLARNSVSGFYDTYSSIGSSGLDTAVGVLFHDVAVEDYNGGTSTAAQVITGGNLFYDKLVGIDATAIASMKAKVVVDGFSNNIFMF